jgi:nicotinamidase-related amidase
MTTLNGRDKSALLVIDVQNGVVDGAFNLEDVIENINKAISVARKSHVPVIWVQHSDEELVLESEDWQIVPQLQPEAGERKVRKVHRSSFEATDLEDILSELRVGHLYLTGMQTNNCVRHTTHSAQERGYDVTILADAHTTTGYEWDGHTVDAEAVVNEFNDNFAGTELPGRFTRAISTSELSFA